MRVCFAAVGRCSFVEHPGIISFWLLFLFLRRLGVGAFAFDDGRLIMTVVLGSDIIPVAMVAVMAVAAAPPGRVPVSLKPFKIKDIKTFRHVGMWFSMHTQVTRKV